MKTLTINMTDEAFEKLARMLYFNELCGKLDTQDPLMNAALLLVIGMEANAASITINEKIIKEVPTPPSGKFFHRK
jgi:hypothetical protein